MPLTRAEHREVLASLAAMTNLETCPIPGCEEGWIATTGCGGHICDWEGHHEQLGR